MLLLPLDLPLNPAPSLAPLFKCRLHLFLPPLIRHLLVLAQKPHLLDILLFHIISGVVVVVVTAALESILVLEDYLLVVVGEEAVKR